VSFLTRPKGGSKNSKNFSGRGDIGGVPRPEILFSLPLKDNFDPPRGRVDKFDELKSRIDTSRANSVMMPRVSRLIED
jgi:hypothetical protein